MKSAKYIVGHNRDRDFYQLAGALAEKGALECLVTDYYSDGSGSWLDRRLSHRKSDLISSDLTLNVPSTILLQGARANLDRLGLDTIYTVNRIIGRKIRKVALSRPDSGLLLYSTYAAESFTDERLQDRDKNLFLFHPHPTLIRELLQPDIKKSGIGREGLLEEAGMAHRIAILDKELAAADLVFCASELTQRSAVRAGVAVEKTKIVPYGIAKPMPPYRNLRHGSKLRFLFVGQAIHRKGVHHLLSAWRMARPERSELVMVCSRSQDGLLEKLPPGVTVKKGLSSQVLWDEYCSADCFILPSLVEGFGLVLLEAMSAGCYTLFSENTGLAGMELPGSIGSQISALDPESIAESLENVAHLHRNGGISPEVITGYSARFSAAAFRERVRQGLGL